MKKIALMMLVAVAAIACEKTPDIVPEIKITTTELTVPVEGNENLVIEFNSNVDWTAKVKEDIEWVTISPAKGVAGDAKITAVVDPTDQNEERKATIEITAGDKITEVVLTQAALPFFTVENALAIPTEGGSFDLAVSTNVPFNVTVEENDWLTVAKGEGKVTFTATENTANDARTAVATFTTEYELGGTVTVSQDGVCKLLWAIGMKDVMNRTARGPMFSTDEYWTGVSIAVYDGNVVVCAGDGSEPVILDKATGEKKGTIATGDFKPYTVRQDDAGNLVMANRLWNRWTAYGNWFRIAYLVPGSTEVKDIIKDVDEEYLGMSMNVRGDVTKNALIALPHNNGEYVHNVISLFPVTDGSALQANVTWDANYKGVGWAGPYFGGGVHNHPGLALVGSTIDAGAVSSCYDANLLQAIDLTSGATTVVVDTPLAGDYAGNFAPNGLDIREINGKQYLAVALSCFYPSTPPTVYLFDVESKQALYTWDDVELFDPQDAASTNYEYVQASVTMEAAEGGVVVYLIDKSSGTIAAKYFKL